MLPELFFAPAFVRSRSDGRVRFLSYVFRETKRKRLETGRSAGAS